MIAFNLFSRLFARVVNATASPLAERSTKWLIGLFSCSLMIWPYQTSLGADKSCSLTLQVIGGAHRMFRQGLDNPVLEITAWSTNGVGHEVEAAVDVCDIFGRTAADSFPPLQVHLAADGSKTRLTVPLAFGIGYYAILVTLNEGGQPLITHCTDLGIVSPPYPGVRPDSFFSTNAGPKQGEDLQFLETVGIKVQRTHFFPGVATASSSWAKDLPIGEAAPLDFTNLDQDWKETQAHGIWVLPVIGYSLVGAGVFDRTPLAERLGMYGPPNDNERFIRTWKAVLEHYPELTTLEFWNEPWIFGWTWAGTPEAYRQLQKQWCTMALTLNPHYRLIAGSSVAFVRDELEPFPDCWEGLLQGVTDHPYTSSVVSRSFRSGDVFRSVDEIRLAARDLGLPFAYLTEGGTAYQSPKPLIAQEPFNNLENAQKLVQYYAQAALAGVFMGNAQEDIGFGPGWTKSNTALATLTHFLEDRVPLVDLWPQQELLWGGIFADHKFITPEIKSLPRGSELTGRWDVETPPDRVSDNTKVAVIWALTGQSARWLDTQGELVIADASDLRAYNLVGQEIPASQGQLILPLSPSPIYLASDRLSVLELRDRIQGGLIRRLTPINFYALSLQAPAPEQQTLTVRLENQINRALKGNLVLRVAGIDTVATVPFEVNAGELTEVRLPWPGHPFRQDNRYAIRLTAFLDNTSAGPAESFPPFSRDLGVSVSRFEKRTIQFTGAFSDWSGLTPVTVDSNWIEPADSGGSALLNPNEKQSPAETESKRVTGQVFTAYDDDFVYLGAAVHEAHFQCSAGQLFSASAGNQHTVLNYPMGEPDGLHYVTECGNVFQFSFGFRDRVPGVGRQINDPWAWKGAFYDADYSYVAHTSTHGDQLIRIWGPDTSRRNGYQTETVPGIGPVPGGTVKINRDEPNKLTLYEIAIPRRQLMLFDPARKQCRFGFILYNGDAIGGGALPWSDAAGVFDYWQSPGSFPPTWKDRVACQTFFGIEP